MQTQDYHSLKCDKKCLDVTTVACQFGKYRFTRLPLRVASAGNMFQQKIAKVFKDLPNVFVITDDISIVDCNANNRDHDKTLK